MKLIREVGRFNKWESVLADIVHRNKSVIN
jgi:hypothetical protein